MLTKSEAIKKLNELGSSQNPFSFYCDFLGEKWCVEESASADPSAFQLIIEDNEKWEEGSWKKEEGRGKMGAGREKLEEVSRDVKFSKHPISFQEFKESFDRVVSEINYGNSFLTNLTFQTPIETNLTLKQIFDFSHAKYRLLVPEKFVVFSPETFIKIKEDCIYSYPMKGTIDASILHAKDRILSDLKETAEHVTIVDLIRNDLSLVAEKVEVTRFRYIDELETNDKKLLQVSSEIKGSLNLGWKSSLGTILSKLLPAGSISGAPKPETLRIIQKNESYERDFYTGICGHFDGLTLDTGVMIRFIKKEKDQLFYCSGGGITSFSQAQNEYEEMVDKIYLAI